jgi:hypothetical protein
MKKIYLVISFFIFTQISISPIVFSQTCTGANSITTTFIVSESRCAATGVIQVAATGGSGVYNYKAIGPVTTPFSSSNIITGLPAGTYQVIIKDVNRNCTKSTDVVVVPGTYRDPRFQLITTNLSCTNGSDGTITVDNQQYGRSPFTYTIIAPSPYGVGNNNTTGIFTGLPHGSYYIQLTDSCGGRQTRLAKIKNYTWDFQSTTVSKFTCNDATVTMILQDINGNLNTSGIGFDQFTYGLSLSPGDTIWSASHTFNFVLGTNRSAVLIAKDKCGTMKSVVWNINNKPTVASSVSYSNIACSTFTARITGQANLTSPQYCLYNSSNTLVSCNTTGQFDNLAYGSSYCINIRDLCYDTTIVRCFTNNKPRPSVDANVQITYPNCTGFIASITGQSNLFDPEYCLYNEANVLLLCNNTGIFNGITYGNYEVRISGGACYDTTIIRTISLAKPIYSVGTNPPITNRTCTDFSVAINGQNNFSTANYCLYNSANVQVACNTTGVFNNLAFGSYCIDVNVQAAGGNCYDTTIRRCVTVAKPIPSVNASVTIHRQTCNTFYTEITNQTNLTSPVFKLYSGTTLLAQNTTGIFVDLTFGSYCIDIEDGCGDTTIRRCFTASPTVVNFNYSASLSCFTGHTKLAVDFWSGFSPFRVEVYDHLNNLVKSISQSSGNFVIDSLPNLPTGSQYKILGYDVCNQFAERFVSPNASTFTKSIVMNANCPGGLQQDGSADVIINTNSNLGTVTPKIIFKNGAGVSINHAYKVGNQYEFYDLDPATYIIRYSFGSCSDKFDTIVVAPYTFPSLENSNAYQCDNSGFSVGAAVTGGAAPYTYEIIGSAPASPSILAGPQTNPVFNINTGATYSLVRLRTVDGCGNATLNDVSVLPLANVIINSTSACWYNDVTLSVDTIPNATYTWYKRVGGTDSVQIGTDIVYKVTNLLPSDTGRYICKVSVNNGCLIRISNFKLSNSCFDKYLLPGENLSLTGKYIGNNTELQWIMKNEAGIKEYIVERSDKQGSSFNAIGKLMAAGRTVSAGNYIFIDNNAPDGINYYRIKAINQIGKIINSNVVAVKAGSNTTISVFPNPVISSFNINFGTKGMHSHHIKLFDMGGRLVFEKMINNSTEQNYIYQRQPMMEAGTYILQVIDLNSLQMNSKRIVFK